MRCLVVATLMVLASCAPERSVKKLGLEGSGNKSVLLTDVSDAESLKKRAAELGLKVEGDVIMRLSGDVDQLNQIELNQEAKSLVDSEVLSLENESFSIEPGSQYLAKKDFGILEFWQQNPKADGRGVIVGVFDDGISPHQSGFRVTSTGERKLLKKGSHSTLSTFKLIPNDQGVFEGEVDETRPSFGSTPDLNGDNKKSQFKAQFVGNKICLDLNLNDSFEAETECRGIFSETGEYFMLPNTNLSIVAEFDRETGNLKLSQPERSGDSHGEGVASVMAAFNQANQNMNGVAPGAQIVDFDVSEVSAIEDERQYTMGNILLALEWLAKNGAEVANISYSLFFSSTEAQDFMSRAVDQLVKKYNIVLSFSAGNNGPGLGSLNRRVIYPDSVIVAGAFVSKELDERVWGVSGLPVEGRVVYYSSRGPGPLGDGGPNMIGPLSSLTHSNPDAGFRAFNGTSSAAPSLAGAAAVLISAIKLEGLKVDAPTVVEAMKMSGKRLKAEPYVFQGHGLPQVGEALEIYKRLISGREFMRLNIRASRGGADRVGGRGVFFLKSKSNNVESIRLDISGVLSALAPSDARVEALTPLSFEYSKGITGSKELWASVSLSRVHLDIDIDEALEGSEGESFGEIKIFDTRNRALLAIVPVTVIDDKSALNRTRQVFSIGPQGSARMHIHAPRGVSAIRVRARGLSGPVQNIAISSFDSHRARTQQVAFTDELWIPIERSGHHQVGLAMNGGAGKEAVVELEVEAMSFELLTQTVSQENPVISLSYEGASSLLSKVDLTPVPLKVAQVVSARGGDIKALEKTLVIEDNSSYTATIRPTRSADFRLLYSNCSIRAVDESGETRLIASSFYSKSKETPETVTFRCMPFDHGAASGHTESWVMEINKSQGSSETREFFNGMSGQKNLTFSKKNPGLYEVIVKPLQGSQRISLGVIEVI